MNRYNNTHVSLKVLHKEKDFRKQLNFQGTGRKVALFAYFAHSIFTVKFNSPYRQSFSTWPIKIPIQSMAHLPRLHLPCLGPPQLAASRDFQGHHPASTGWLCCRCLFGCRLPTDRSGNRSWNNKSEDSFCLIVWNHFLPSATWGEREFLMKW